MSKLSTSDTNLEIGSRLLVIRTQRCLTQLDIATKTGLSLRAYANYERGEREVPAALLTKLVEVFRIDPLWLLTGQGAQTMTSNPSRLDPELLEKLLEFVEGAVASRCPQLSAHKKARVLSTAYQWAIKTGAVDTEQIQQMLELAS